MKKALITGGSGFIGSYLCRELLENNYYVTVYDHHEPSNQDVKFVQGDILEAELLRKVIREQDVIFHLAGKLGTDYLCEFVREAVEVNIIGSINVFEAAKEFGVKVINTGLIPEWDNPYMITKKAIMKLGRMYFREFGAAIITMEVTHVYGPCQPIEPYRKAIPNFIVNALRDEPLVIYGSGQKSMDCIYVEDVALALRLMSESSKVSGKVFQVGSGKGTKVVELADMILSLTKSNSSLDFRTMRPGEPDIDSTVDINLEDCLLLFGWKPTTILTEGLLKTIEWYSKHFSLPHKLHSI